MYIGFLLFTIGYAVCSISNNLIILLTATVILSIGELLYVPIRQSILSEIIDENKRGAYMALNSLVIQFGKFVASSCLLVSPYLNKFMMGSIVLIFGLLSILLH
ncbi:MFS transporter [Cytobacillus firmus]|uniref:MFS transporter n=1 Tax=Cytobacillus firmus TaxID=1399 RepID=UPI0018CE2EEB